MWRSATRWRRCCHTPRGSSEKQIFGNCVLPENRPNQILARLLLESRFPLLHESPVGGLQILLGIEFCPHSPFRQSDQGTAHRKMALFRDAPDFACEGPGDGNALTERLRPGGARHCLGSARHTFMLADTAPVWCRLGQRRSWQGEGPAPPPQTRDLPWWRRRFRLRTVFFHSFLGSAFLASEQQFGERVKRRGKRNMHHAFLPADPDGFEHTSRRGPTRIGGNRQRDQGAEALFEA